MGQKYIQTPSLFHSDQTFAIHHQESILTLFDFFSVTISQFLLLYHRKFSEVQSQTFVDLENCIFEGYLNLTLKRFLQQQKESKITIVSAGIIWQF